MSGARLAAPALALFTAAAAASSDPFTGIAAPGAAGIGFLGRAERSPYAGAGTRFDFVPMYLYEGSRAYLHSLSLGLKLEATETRRFEVFLRHRFEGHPTDDIPPRLAGMARREPGIDAGVGAQLGGPWGVAFAELLRDASQASNGAELRLGYQYPVRFGALTARPHAMVSVRSSSLNNYYYGVRPEEATSERPAYEPGLAAMPEVGVQLVYRLSSRWRLLAGVSAARLPDALRASPLVDRRTLAEVELGALYDISPEQDAWPRRPLIARALYGDSSGCDAMEIATFRCTSTHTEDNTSIAGFELGRPFIDRLNGWPLDLAGFIGLTHHFERGAQSDFAEIRAYIKAYFYGFPWDAKLRTRIGLGVGLSYANQVPFSEQRDQARRGRTTSRLLNTFDPTADFSLGDLLAVPRLRETYLGVGVSHRSGIFGTSQLLRNVSGGSNYIYGYVETSF